MNPNPTDDGSAGEDPIAARMAAQGLYEEDLLERFIKGSGPGGQKINKTASCVYLKHVPTGVEVKCQEGRSLTDNRQKARELLCLAFEKRAEKERLHRGRAQARARYQKRRPSPAQKARRVEGKRRQGLAKRLRSRPPRDDG